jgi:chemotaxis protein MotB
MDAQQPIIVKKKKGGHGGHHGGAWKVAYADFVTAMMSLFIVLWLMSSTSKQTQEEIAGYFNDPKGTATKKGSTGTPTPSDNKQGSPKKDDMASLKVGLTKAIEKMNLLNSVKKQIEISITDEGLRIELVEDEKGTFFESGKAQPTPMLEQILKVLAGQLKDLPNHISIEGYTDAQPYVNGTAYGNWELSTDRANVARREMQENGIRLDQVSQVRGFADQKLHVPSKPFDAANRRVSLVVQNLPTDKDKANPIEGQKQVVAKVSPDGAAPAQQAEATAKPTAAVLPSAVEKPAGGLLARAKGMFGHK